MRMRTELRLVASLSPRLENVDHQIGRAKYTHLERARIRTRKVAHRIMAQTKSANRGRPWHDRRDFRCAVRVGRNIGGFGYEIGGPAGEDADESAGLAHRHAACPRRHDDEALG